MKLNEENVNFISNSQSYASVTFRYDYQYKNDYVKVADTH